MKVIFVQAAVGRKPGAQTYPKTWIMEPLWAATIAALLPKDCERQLMDDRLGEVDTTVPADAVLISTECYTARRAYEIADRFRSHGTKVVMGGFHATLNPDEAAEHADALLLGAAENVWADFWRDLQAGTLRARYESAEPPRFGPLPDRSLFGTHRYGPLCLIETARGCRLRCDFCSICKYFRHAYVPRPIEDVVAELKTLKRAPVRPKSVKSNTNSAATTTTAIREISVNSTPWSSTSFPTPSPPTVPRGKSLRPPRRYRLSLSAFRASLLIAPFWAPILSFNSHD